jgi:drug/metabolite transporter (DMT)-like permease
MTETHVNNPYRIILAISLSTLFFGIMNMFVKLAAESVPVPEIMFFRNIFGLLPVILLIWHRRDWSLLKTERPAGHFVRSFVGFFSMCCMFWSYALLPLANATAIQFATPLIVTALSVLLLDEFVGRHRWAAVIIGLAAVFFMLHPSVNSDPLGSMIAICAAILSAFAMITVRKLGSTEHALTIAFYFMLFSAVMSGIWAGFLWEPLDWKNLLFLVTMGLLGGCGQIGLTYAYSGAPASFVSPFTYGGIVVAAFIDLSVWGIVPGWEIWVGSAVVIGSGLYISLRETRKHYASTVGGLSPDPNIPAQTERDLKDEGYV